MTDTTAYRCPICGLVPVDGDDSLEHREACATWVAASLAPNSDAASTLARRVLLDECEEEDYE